MSSIIKSCCIIDGKISRVILQRNKMLHKVEKIATTRMSFISLLCSFSICPLLLLVHSEPLCPLFTLRSENCCLKINDLHSFLPTPIGSLGTPISALFSRPLSVLLSNVRLICVPSRKTQLHIYQTTRRHAPINPFCCYSQ
jgi:hypothetical protein